MSEAEEIEVTEERSVEDQAKDIGWNPNGSKSAEEFVNARNDNLGAALADVRKLNAKLDNQDATIKAMAKHLEKQEQATWERAYAQAKREAKTEMREASKEGDTDAYEAAEKRLDQLDAQEKEKLSTLEPVVPADTVSPEQRIVMEHAQANEHLFDTSAKMEDWANEFRYQVEKRGKSVNEALSIADKEVVKKHNLSRSVPGPSDSGGPAPASVGKFADLPKEAKDAYFAFKKEYGDDYTQETFLEQYNA